MAKDTTYVCAVGIDHPKGRHERGETYSGPAKSIDWLVDSAAIVPQGSDEAAAIAAELAAATDETEA